MTRYLLLAGLVTAAAAVFLATRGPDARAIAPCVAHVPTGEETTFLNLLQQWRNSNIPGSVPLSQSGPLNAAAYGYAQFLANNPSAQGHGADGASGYPWVTRAVNCGYPADWGAGGEGLGVFMPQESANATAQGALNRMTSEGGGGVWVPSDVGLPVQCVGVGRAVSTSGKVAWVVLLFAANGACPGGAAGGTTTTTTASPTTATPTATPTKTPTPSPTPSPTPTPRGDGATVTLFAGWNLVTLPAGPVADVLHRAAGCYRAIYQQQGNQWFRYSPEVPAWANNLQTLNGGTFWVEGTAENCGIVPL